MDQVIYRARAEQLSWREVEGEVVLLDERGWNYLHLNGTGATLWKALNDGSTLDALVDALLAEYEVPRAVAEADTRDLLSHLVARGLISLDSNGSDTPSLP